MKSEKQATEAGREDSRSVERDWSEEKIRDSKKIIEDLLSKD